MSRIVNKITADLPLVSKDWEASTTDLSDLLEVYFEGKKTFKKVNW